MVQKPILHCMEASIEAAGRPPVGRDLEALIRYLPTTMVPTLDQRMKQLEQLARRKCSELQTTLPILEKTPTDDLSVDERLLLEIFRLIDYIEYLRR